jgi:hypothetical protein
MDIVVIKESKKALQMSKNDNVAIALEDVEAGDKISVLTLLTRQELRIITASENISFGHKIALEKISSNAKIMKYSYEIGLATKKIQIGEHVHLHNIASQYLHETE